MVDTRLKGILQDYETLEGIQFYRFEPITKSRDVNYADVSVRGRSEPHVFYTDTTAKTIPITIHLDASMDQGDNGKYQTVRDKENFVESLVMPDYSGISGNSSFVSPPHLVRFKILRLIDVIGTLRNYSATDVPPYDIITGYPQIVDISFTIHVQSTVNEIQDYKIVRNWQNRGSNILK